MSTITIRTSRPYDVVVEEGLLQNSGIISRKVTGTCKVCIISDKTVHDQYMPMVAASFSQAGYNVRKAVVPEGEASKSLNTFRNLLDYLAQEEFTRKDILVALGGGAIGDIAGFTAACYLRGIPYIQIPTTLLAAVDGSIGGKTGINLDAGKNLAGAFWQPSLVLYDPQTAGTLSESVFLDGLAEVIKCGAISGNDLFTYVARGEEQDFTKFITHCTHQAMRIKKDLVEQDEKDTGVRQLLNFGHTGGHAIEKCSNYTISHGAAVAMGMMISAKAAHALGWSRYDCSLAIGNVLDKYGFTKDCDFTAEQLTQAALHDKKRKGDNISLVIPLKIGECALMDVPLSVLHDFFKAGVTPQSK